MKDLKTIVIDTAKAAIAPAALALVMYLGYTTGLETNCNNLSTSYAQDREDRESQLKLLIADLNATKQKEILSIYSTIILDASENEEVEIIELTDEEIAEKSKELVKY
ncbi:MAG: hypothetical protein U9N59_10505 [Campylobacterota bacterium]|nr:hypothetical protein [Campylobacterota bacterium]